MSQHNFKIKLASGLWATGLVDVMGGVRDSTGMFHSTGSIYRNFIEEIVAKSGAITDRTSFNELVDKTLADPKHKYILAVYATKVY